MEAQRYRVEHLQTSTYQVFVNLPDFLLDDDLLAKAYSTPEFQGSLSDCEAYIKLKQNNDVDF